YTTPHTPVAATAIGTHARTARRKTRFTPGSVCFASARANSPRTSTGARCRPMLSSEGPLRGIYFQYRIFGVLADHTRIVPGRALYEAVVLRRFPSRRVERRHRGRRDRRRQRHPAPGPAAVDSRRDRALRRLSAAARAGRAWPGTTRR